MTELEIPSRVALVDEWLQVAANIEVYIMKLTTSQLTVETGVSIAS